MPLLATTLLLGALDAGAKGLGGGERKPCAWAVWTREENMPGRCGGWCWGPYPGPRPPIPIAPGLIIVIAAGLPEEEEEEEANVGPIAAIAAIPIPIGAGGGR